MQGVPARQTPPPADTGGWEYVCSAVELLELKKRIAERFAENSLVPIKGDVEQELLFLYSHGVEFEDVTENTLLQTRIKDGMLTQPLFLANEGAFRSGRIYAPKVKAAKSIIKFEELAYNLQADDLSLASNTHEVPLKRVVEVCVVFWSSATRTTRETSTSKTISIFEAQIPNEPNRGTQSTNTTTVQHSTTTITGSDYVKSFTDLYLPRGHEVILTINQVASAVFADAWITLLTE